MGEHRRGAGRSGSRPIPVGLVVLAGLIAWGQAQPPPSAAQTTPQTTPAPPAVPPAQS